MASIFSNENAFWRPFSFMADVMILSILWMFCSLPLVTMGAATTALYDCTAHCVRGHEQGLFSRFFRTFKREFLPSLLTSLLWAAIVGLGFYLIRSFGNGVAVSQSTTLLTVALLFVLSVVAGFGCWVLPVLSRFTFTFGALHITALKLAAGHIFRTILMGVLSVVSVYLTIRFIVPILFLPELVMMAWAALLEPVFSRYIPEE